jgi:hypothetical protein
MSFTAAFIAFVRIKNTEKRKISCMVLKALWVHFCEKFCLLSPDSAHLCLTPSTFENSTFFVRS